VEVAGDRRERRHLLEEIETAEGRIEIDVAEIQGAADEGVIDGADLIGEARRGRGVLRPVECPNGLDGQLHAMAGADVPHGAQRVPLLGVQALDFNLWRSGNPPRVLD
jgi:hypothetical protein